MKNPDEENTGSGLSSYGKAIRTAGPLFTSGLQMAVAVVLMIFLGRWLDDKFGTDPWLMTLGALIGSGGGLYSFIKTALEVSRAESEKNSSKNKK